MLKPLEVLRFYPEHDYTLKGAFESRLKSDPQRPFMLFSGKRWSWTEFGEAVEQAACLFAARGVQRGDRVGVISRNHEGHVIALFALAQIGAIMVPVNPEYGVQEARYVLHHAEVCGVIASGETVETARKACEGLATSPWFMLLDAASGSAPNFLDEARRARQRPLPGGVTGDTACLIIYTSGTTGFPKGAMHSQRSFILCGEAFVQRVYLQPDDRVMIVLPLFHVNALFYSLAGVVAAGCSAAVVSRFSASTFWDAAVETGATEVNIIEAIGTILKNRPRDEFRKEHRIRRLYGARQPVMDTFRNEFGIPHLISGFGMTEIPGVTCSPFEVPGKPGSMGLVGRHPDPSRPWAQCRVVDDEGRDLPANEAGEFAVKTPIVMQGYFRDPEQTKAAFRDGWFLTGDLVRRDEEGWFYFVGRKKDIIRRRGENISGAELDRVIGEHPAVHEAAAIAVPSELGEDEILVAVLLKPGQSCSVEDIAAWSRHHLAPQKVPRFVVFVDDLPHTPTHKVQKAQLRADASLRTRAVDLQSGLGKH
jgi:crotonobetaine/carnitine-CoA ligase